MIKNSWVQVLLLSNLLFCCLQLESRQHAYSYYDQPYYQASRSSSTSDQDMAVAAVIIVIIIFVGFFVLIGVVCYYCIKAIKSRISNTREYVGNPALYAAPHNPNNFNPPPNYYYNQQNLPVQRGVPANSATVSPYGPTSDRDRLNGPCDSCNIKYKQGEEPRAMVGCQSKHIFHLTCLGQAIKYQHQLSCPRCEARIPYTIKLFCISCKTSNATVNLQQFRNPTSGLDFEALKSRFGECCPSCLGL